MLRAVVLLFLSSLWCGVGSAQPRAPAPRALSEFRAPRDPGRLAQGAAIAGLVGAGLMLSGTLAIELVDRPKSEAVTRGVHLGVTALAAPLVAFASYSLRRHEDSEGGVDALRTMGWAFYTASIALGVAQLYDALHDRPVSHGLGFLYGGLAVLSLLPHCFDAYLTARSARLPTLLVVTPAGLVAKF